MQLYFFRENSTETAARKDPFDRCYFYSCQIVCNYLLSTHDLFFFLNNLDDVLTSLFLKLAFKSFFIRVRTAIYYNFFYHFNKDHHVMIYLVSVFQLLTEELERMVGMPL